MKKRITKIWSIGLVVIVLASMLLMAAPVSAADPLTLNQEAIPTDTGYQLASGTDITQFAVGGDGTTIFAVTGNTTLFKSVDGGKTWTMIDLTLAGTGLTSPSAVNLVAVAPDDSNFIAVANSATPVVYISTNGGSTWGNLLAPEQSGGNAAAVITDIAVSQTSGTSHYLAVSGAEASGAGNVWYYVLGIGGAWKQTNDKFGYNTQDVAWTGSSNATLAVSFSPNFPSDLTLMAVITNSANTTFEMFNLSATNLKWNNAGFGIDAAYPVKIWNGSTAITDATGASIGLAPTFTSNDQSLLVGFVALTTAATTNAGIFRIENTTVLQIKPGVNFNSVAFNGSVMVAGETAASRVWRVEDPLDTSPTAYQNASMKGPGGANSVQVAFAGVSFTQVVAATRGTSSAFAVSNDNGKDFNDISFINTSINNIEDFAVSPDGTKMFILTDNGADCSVFRYASILGWQRVLTLTGAGATQYIVRTSPTNFNVVYIAQIGSGNIYYQTAGGDAKWNTRGVSVTDMAVESDTVAYVAWASGVSKTTNGGSIWQLAVPTGVTAIYSLTSIGANNLLVGSTDGYVAYSADGDLTWTKIPVIIKSTAINVKVVADNLATGGYVWAGTGDSSGSIYRWKIGQATTDGWKSMADSSGYPIRDIKLQPAGTSTFMYAVSANSSGSKIKRSSSLTSAAPSAGSWGTISSTAVFDLTPSALRISVDTSSNVKLWSASGPTLYSWLDTLTVSAPALVSPANGATIQMNPISGEIASIPFTWGKVSLSTKYDLTVGFDAALTQVGVKVSSTSTSTVVTSQNVTFMPGTTYYWKVAVASDGPVSSPSSAVWSFTVASGPALVPNIGSPINGGIVTTTTPAFSWSPVSGTTKYQFQLAMDPSFVTTVDDEQTANTGIKTPVSLLNGTTYFWRVKALQPLAGEWSTISNFTVTLPVAPTSAAPPVTITQPAPTISIPPITIPQPTFNLPAQPTTPAAQPISMSLLWAVIIIGAVLVIAVIVLIVRTRRTV